MNSRLRLGLGLVFLSLVVPHVSSLQAADLAPITAPPPALRLDPFYRKYLDAEGLPVVSSAAVSDPALREAANLVHHMLAGRPDVRAAMIRNKLRVAVMAATERTTDLPEQRTMTPKAYWDVRARGLGASRDSPVVSCGEENLLGFPGDPYRGENILIHEFAHATEDLGLRDVDPTFRARLKASYHAALDKGLWKSTYAATNPDEYWAEVVQSWFDCNQSQPNASHNEVDTREELKTYDPGVVPLLVEVYGDGPYRYQPPSLRKSEEASHLDGFDPSQSPTFSWGESQTRFDAFQAERREQKRRQGHDRALPKGDEEAKPSK